MSQWAWLGPKPERSAGTTAVSRADASSVFCRTALGRRILRSELLLKVVNLLLLLGDRLGGCADFGVAAGSLKESLHLGRIGGQSLRCLRVSRDRQAKYPEHEKESFHRFPQQIQLALLPPTLVPKVMVKPLVLGLAVHQVPIVTDEQVHGGIFGNPAANTTWQLVTLPVPTVIIPPLSVEVVVTAGPLPQVPGVGCVLTPVMLVPKCWLPGTITLFPFGALR